MRNVIRYSEAFKLRVVEDVVNGKYASFNEALRRNGIRGHGTVVKWLKQYGREDILPKRIKVETMNEIDEMKVARSRIRELEAALADAHMDYYLESAFLEIAYEKLETTAEDLKRKNGITLAGRRKRRGRFEVSDGHRVVKPEAGHEPAELLQRAEAEVAEGSGRRADRVARPRRAGGTAASWRASA
jgi:transposase-like protein